MSHRLSEKTLGILCDQVTKELQSEALYRIMSSECIDRGYTGAAHWLKKQGDEEHSHALKIINYIEDRGNIIKSLSYDDTDFSFVSLPDTFTKIYQHEEKVTTGIHYIYTIAKEEDDYATEVFIHEFIKEQTEEVAIAEQWMDELSLAGENMAAILLIDHKLESR